MCVCVCVCVVGGGGGGSGGSLGVVGGRGLGVIRLKSQVLGIMVKMYGFIISFTLLVWDQLSNQCPPPRSHTHLIPAERNVHL